MQLCRFKSESINRRLAPEGTAITTKERNAGRELARLLWDEGEYRVIRARLAGMIAFWVVMGLFSVSNTAFRQIAGKQAHLPRYGGLAFITLLPLATFGSYKIKQWRGYRMIREAERYREEYGTAKRDLAKVESRDYPKSLGWLDCYRQVIADLSHGKR